MDQDMKHLVLNDRSVTLEKERSSALGLGWRSGVLGSLHSSVFKERLENEYGAKIILTAPTVLYKIKYKDGTEKIETNPDDFPGSDYRSHDIDMFMEPFVDAIITIPEEYVDTVMKVCEANRGAQTELEYFTSGHVLLKYELPMA